MASQWFFWHTEMGCFLREQVEKSADFWERVATLQFFAWFLVFAVVKLPPDGLIMSYQTWPRIIGSSIPLLEVKKK